MSVHASKTGCNPFHRVNNIYIKYMNKTLMLLGIDTMQTDKQKIISSVSSTDSIIFNRLLLHIL